MFIDALELDDGAELEADLCIIGAGAAGLAIAAEFLQRRVSVIVVESGGFQYEQQTQALYLGEEEGTLLRGGENYLASTRLRYFGGTTNHWNGWCRPLDPEDLRVRSWVPHSGWPLQAEELAPFYDRAADLLGVSRFGSGEGVQPDESRPEVLSSPGALETTYFHVSAPTRLGQVYRRPLQRSRRTRVLLHANAIELVANESGRGIVAVRLGILGSKRLTVKVRNVVVATGAIENARLLLASNRVHPRGVGNEYDVVGRYFMEHPMVNLAQITLPRLRGQARAYRPFRLPGGYRARGTLRVTGECQERRGLLNTVMVMKKLFRWESHDLAEGVSSVAQQIAELASGRHGTPSAEPYPYLIRLATEQIPNPDSRVSLSANRDAFGAPRTRLQWQLTSQDRDNLAEVTRLLVARLSESLEARLRLLVDLEDPWASGRASPHQMGTTRMHRDLKHGVVDENCRVHGVGNLFVAGGSVFPTSGCSNPTLTLVALALRLADHLKDVVKT